MNGQEETKPSGTLAELAQIRAEARAQAVGKSAREKEESAGEPETQETEVAVSAEAEEVPVAEQEPEELIRIGDKTFKTQSEAIRYAEELEHAKEVAEAQSYGIQETLRAIQTPSAPVTPVDDKFEEKFYTDPKGTLADVERKATEKALEIIRREQSVEEQWRIFFDENPDLSGQRVVAQTILNQNSDLFSKVTDLKKGRALLATKTRAIFQDYEERKKPRTELPAGGRQAVSPSGGTGVTPKVETKQEKPLDFVSQLRNARRGK